MLKHPSLRLSAIHSLSPQALRGVLGFAPVAVGFAVFIVSGCISVKVGGPSKPERAQVSASAPRSPFSEHKSQWSDRAWKNSETGSVISYLSDCQPSADVSLQSLRDDVMSALKRAKVLRETSLQFEAREALRSIQEGEVDGVLTTVDLLAFKKNGCSYTITLVALPKFLSQDQSAFDEFLRGFKAP